MNCNRCSSTTDHPIDIKGTTYCPRCLIRYMLLDASRYLTSFDYDHISDDDTDYLPACSSLNTHAIAALTDDAPDAACLDLIDRMLAATDDNDPDFLLADIITAPFHTRLFTLIDRS